jgi:hypothetical protein
MSEIMIEEEIEHDPINIYKFTIPKDSILKETMTRARNPIKIKARGSCAP